VPYAAGRQLKASSAFSTVLAFYHGRISHIRLGGSISKCTNVYFWTLSSENMPKLKHHVNVHLHTLKLLKTKTVCIQDVPDLNLSQGTDCSEVSKTFLTTSMQMPE